MNPIKLLTRICFFYILLIYYNCSAKELYFQPSVDFKALYDDNIRLITNKNNISENKDAFGFISSANANFGVNTDRLNIDINAAVLINRYISDFELDSENIYLNTYSTYDVNENNKFGLAFDYIRDTTLYSVIDALATQDNVLRETVSINPEWIYDLSNSTSIRVDYKYSDVTYGQSSRNQQFFDYTSNFSSLKLMHKWNDYINYYTKFDALLYDAPDANNKTTNYNFLIGMDYRLLETWISSFEIGMYSVDNEVTDIDGNKIKDNAIDPIFLFKIKKSFETSSIEARYLRKTIPRGVGGFSEIDSSLLRYSHNFSDQWKVSLKARYNKTKGIFDSTTNFTVYSAGVDINWLIDQQIYLTTSYLFKHKIIDETNATADSNSISISINYLWDFFSTSEF